jgi:branched-chain amino acid transport system substrate-binding protein
MTRVRTCVVLVALVSLLAAACGDDDDTDAAGSTTTQAEAGGDTTTTTPSADCALDEPVRVIGLAEKPPEGPNAIPDYDEGFQLALEEIEAAGGICGQPLEFERIAASPTDPNLARNAYLQALDEEPHAIVGINASTAMIAVAPEVEKAEIPTIYFGTSPQVLANTPDGVGSPWGFLIRPITTGIAQMQVDYVVDELDATRVGLLCLNAPFGQAGCDAVAAQATARGVEIVAREVHEATDTDFTSKAVALKNANPDVVLAYTFPNFYITFINQLTDNGLDVPVFGTGANLSVASGGIKAEALPNVWGVEDCVPAGDPDAADWVARYEAKFDKAVPSFAVAEAYDSLMMLKQAVETAGSVDPQAIADELRSQTHDGICDTYKADAGQAMHHSSTFEQFDADGVPEIKKKVDIPPA